MRSTPPGEAVELTDPQLITNPQDYELSQPVGSAAYWQTPGLSLAQDVGGNPLVRFIGEKVEQDYLQVIVVLDDDPEELLDLIFRAEQSLYTKFKGFRFDVRVRVVPPGESIEAIENSTLVRYIRPHQ